MISTTTDRFYCRPHMRLATGVAWCALALLLSATLVSQQAFAYFNRGSVSVALGTTDLELQAGSTSNVTVALSPSSDEQTEGCGMPKCPQGCSESCTDENGQCGCAGSEYSTYYPTAVASSSNASVAEARYSAGVLTVYAKSEGEATVTVRASLRQFTDAEATLTVRVTGSASGQQDTSGTFVSLPEEAAEAPDDRAALVDKTVMGRAIRYVRLGEGCDASAELASFAGTDGDLTFWRGDTYYRPDYSLTFTGLDYAAEDVSEFDPDAVVSSEAQGALNQTLSGLDGYLIVDLSKSGVWPAQATVYARADGVFSDDDALALFSYDADAMRFVREDAAAAVVGGYACFSVSEAKAYVVSARDLSAEARPIIEGGQESSAQGSCCPEETVGQALPAAVVAIIVAVVAAASIAATALVCHRRRERENKE